MGLKKGLYFTMDAFLAAMLLLGGIVLIHQLTVTETTNTHIDYLSKDILTALDQIPISSINDTFIKEELANGNITDENITILEQLANYWAVNDTDKANTLANLTLASILPDDYGFRLRMSDKTLYEQAHNLDGNLVSSRRMISGIDEGKPKQGSSSHGYLRSITDKRNSAYAYFGGFAGQGNVTVRLEQLPVDVNETRITAILLEADIQKNFTVEINDQECANLTAQNNTVQAWNLTACKSALVPGINNISIGFADLNKAYVGGGYVKVDYQTDEFFGNKTYNQTTYHFPAIDGIVNLFDAFHVPGTLENMHIFLHYLANHTAEQNNTFYLSIGDRIVYSDTASTDEVAITLDDLYLSALLNYTLYTNNTVPFRLGFENLTYATEYYGNADVVLITDVSGSMDWRFDSSYSGTERNCDSPYINYLSTQRLSVAKCLDKDFAQSILNVTGNQLGLVSYEAVTDSTLALDTDLTAINNEIGMGVGTPYGYEPGGGTCICCGINSAQELLTHDLQRTVLISSRSTWHYDNDHLDGQIPNDANNDTWHSQNYLPASGWDEGPAILGHDAGVGGVSVDTDIGSDLYGDDSLVDLWELNADKDTPELDFTSGLNSTANTYGISQPNDGWDWSSDVFDYTDDDFNYFGVYNGRLLMRTPNSDNDESSGAFAVSVQISQEQYDILQNDGYASLSFDYWWDDYNNYFENNDEVWLKARWTSPYSGAHYLGSDLDYNHNHRDYTPEIDARDNPNVDIVDEHYQQTINDYIEGPGTYYLELGGKLERSASNEWGYFLYDNILLTIRNSSDHYYFRKHFTVDDLHDVERGVINILADDDIRIYLNGNLILEQFDNNATYWDITGYNIDGDYFKLGDNVLAAELINNNASARFDLELIGINDSKNKAMMLMTDGLANRECWQQGYTGDLDGDGYADSASDDAIQAACDAAESYGTIIYAVGFSDEADETTLREIAGCGNGLFKRSYNTTELQVFYEDVVLDILEISRKSQSVVVASGTPITSSLYPDSYITINHQQTITPPQTNEIEVTIQTPPLQNCTDQVTIPPGVRLAEAKVLSYSGEHWTALVQVDDHVVFNLSEYADEYQTLGDPFAVHIPVKYLSSGTHNLTIQTADNKDNYTGCSQNNSLIYNGFVNSSTTRSTVIDVATGCNWTVEFEDGTTNTFNLPASYSGAKHCAYTNSSHDQALYETDAYDVAVYDLLSQLDFDQDGRVFVNLAAEDLEIIVNLVSDVPYLWGPAIIKLEAWQ